MTKQKHPVWLQYLNARLLELGFGILKLLTTYLPHSWLMALGKNLGYIAMLCTPRRCQITDINLKLCFPEFDLATRRSLRQRHFESLGMGMLDMCLAWWAPTSRLQSLLHVKGIENINTAFEKGQGVIFVSAHFSSLEMGGRFVCNLWTIHPVYRPHRSAQLEEFILAQRVPHTGWCIPRHDIRLLLRTLQQGHGVWLAPDQNFSNPGYVFAPFFGIPAATTTAIIKCARISGAPVLPFIIMRLDDATGYRIIIEPALDNFPSADIQQDVVRLNAIFERWIRQAPEQYLWSHRRFKDRPEGEAGFY